MKENFLQSSIFKVVLTAVLLVFNLVFSDQALAATLSVDQLSIDACDQKDPGAQPILTRPIGASCYVLSGEVTNPGNSAVIDSDVFAQILDPSGEPVLPNRARVGSIGDVQPGSSIFAVRLAIPAGTPEPLQVKGAKVKGFKAPVRTRAGDDDELLPLEQAVEPGLLWGTKAMIPSEHPLDQL